MSKIGRFGEFGGQYVPETVMNAVHELEEAYDKYKNDPQFQKELADLYRDYANRPSMLYYAQHMTEDLGGAKIYLVRYFLQSVWARSVSLPKQAQVSTALPPLPYAPLWALNAACIWAERIPKDSP